jgi:membrane-associated phospholipid phosphatase
MSLHATAIGGLIGFLIYFSSYYKINLLILIASLFILSGFISTSRLNLKAHKLNEVTYGYLIGICSQIITYLIYIM